MIFNKKWTTRLALFSIFAGLLMLLLLWGGPPTLAQEHISLVFAKIHHSPQSVAVSDAEGTSLGSGEFRATVSNNRNGRTNGYAKLEMPDFTLEIEFTAVDEILYENDTPVGVVLSGRGTLLRAGQTETFPATATVGATTTIPDCLIWDIPGAPVIGGLNFEAEGTLRFREG